MSDFRVGAMVEMIPCDKLVIDHFSPIMRHSLSFGIEMKNKLADDHLSAVHKKYGLTFRRLRVTSEMGNGGKNPMRSFLWFFPPFLWHYLSSGVEMKNELSNDRLSAICKKYGLTIAVICQNDAYDLLQRWAMEEKITCDHFFEFFLRSCGIISRQASRCRIH